MKLGMEDSQSCFFFIFRCYLSVFDEPCSPLSCMALNLHSMFFLSRPPFSSCIPPSLYFAAIQNTTVWVIYNEKGLFLTVLQAGKSCIKMPKSGKDLIAMTSYGAWYVCKREAGTEAETDSSRESKSQNLQSQCFSNWH